jgi:hypothetical protein
MSLILAVEPDGTHAVILRRIVGQMADARLIVVGSAPAAATTMNRQVPDLVLLAESLDKNAREHVVDHFILASDASEPQTLTIPPLRTGAASPAGTAPGRSRRSRTPVAAAAEDAFAETIAACLARIEGNRRDPANEAQGDADESPGIAIDLATSKDERASVDTEAHEARVAALQAQAEAQLKSELERVRREAAEHAAAEAARLRTEAEATLEAGVAQARDAAAAEAGQTLATELARASCAADERVANEVARVRAEASEQLAQQAEQLAQQRSAAENAAVVARDYAVECAVECAVEQAKAEATAHLTAQFTAQIGRVQDDAERAHVALEQKFRKGKGEAEAAAARALDVEVARVRAESDTRHSAALTAARHEAEQALLSERQAHAGVLAGRDAADTAERQKRAAAEAAARTRDADLQRTRDEAEARLHDEMARARVEAEQARERLRQAATEIEAVRAGALEAQSRAAFEAEALRAATRETRAAADAAIARAEEVELARRQAESRLLAEVDGLRGQLDQMQSVHRLELDQVREQSERSARERAAARIDVERARIESDAETRIAAEVAVVQAEAERRRTAALAAIRAQLEDVQDKSDPDEGEHDDVQDEDEQDEERAVMAEPVAAVASADTPAAVACAETVPPPPAVVVGGGRGGLITARSVARIAALIVPFAIWGGGLVVGWLVRRVRAAAFVSRHLIDRVPARTAAAVALLVLAGAGLSLLALSPAASSGRSRARSASARVLERAVHALPATLRSARTAAAATSSASLAGQTPVVLDEPEAPDIKGFLTVFSRVPLELRMAGRRVGTTEEQQIMLAAGRYDIELVSTRLNYRGHVTLSIKPGQLTYHAVTLPDGQLQLETEPGAAVTIEGQPAGVAPLGLTPVAIGTREVVVRHPDFGERRAFVEVHYGTVTELRIPLTDTTRRTEDPRMTAVLTPPATP